MTDKVIASTQFLHEAPFDTPTLDVTLIWIRNRRNLAYHRLHHDKAPITMLMVFIIRFDLSYRSNKIYIYVD